MNLLLHQIAHDIGGFEVVEAEIKHEVYEEFDGHEIIWVVLLMVFLGIRKRVVWC